MQSRSGTRSTTSRRERISIPLATDRVTMTVPPLLGRRAHRPGATGRVPGGDAAPDVPRIEPALPQRARHVAADVEAIGAIHGDRLLGRELADPLVDPVRITPRRAVHQIHGARDVM